MSLLHYPIPYPYYDMRAYDCMTCVPYSFFIYQCPLFTLFRQQRWPPPFCFVQFCHWGFITWVISLLFYDSLLPIIHGRPLQTSILNLRRVALVHEWRHNYLFYTYLLLKISCTNPGSFSLLVWLCCRNQWWIH